MKQATTTWERWREPGVGYYLSLCLGSLALVFLVLQARGLSPWWVLMPVLAGALGAVFCWRPGAVIFLVVLTITVSAHENRPLFLGRTSGFRAADLLLCIAALGYVAGQYRLLGLVRAIFPDGGHSARIPTLAPEASVAQRSAASVPTAEVARLLLTLPVWAGLAQVVSALLPTELANPGLVQPYWRALALLWLLGVIGLTCSAALDYYHRRHMSVDEATLYLQDVVWHDTRGEQRSLNRWLAWAKRGCPLGPVKRLFSLMCLTLLATWLVFLIALILYVFVL